ncbi:hypothetical protein ACFWNW_19670 [Streptomyces seoulensis]
MSGRTVGVEEERLVGRERYVPAPLLLSSSRSGVLVLYEPPLPEWDELS